MSKTNAQIELLSDYDTVIVNYSNGIDSMGILYWALENFPREKIFLIYNDTGLEYEINDSLFYRTLKFLNLRGIILRNDKDFITILHERQMWPDMKNRWCTAYLKTGVTDKWIRHNRDFLGERVLYLTGERRDESSRRAKLPDLQLHRTTLKTERKGRFTCHWYRPVLEYEKGKMFEWGKSLKLDPHPCYEYVGRCSCMACMFMPDNHVIENMRRHPDKARLWIQSELRIGHTWKNKISLKELWDTHCEDIPLDIVV